MKNQYGMLLAHRSPDMRKRRLPNMQTTLVLIVSGCLAGAVGEQIRSKLAFALSRGADPEFADERGEGDAPQHVLSFAMGRP